MIQADPKKLPHLLKLLDDESETVQKVLFEELKAFGFSLENELDKLSPQPTAQQKKLIHKLFENQQRAWLKESWMSWMEIENEKEKLEAAFHLLSEFQSGTLHTEKLKTLLDGLAREYRQACVENDTCELAHFLFRDKGFKGADKDYYNPQNSNLVYCIKEKKGIPISLCCIYMLVGKRAGLKIEGCNLPGHFMAKTVFKGKNILVDCFNEGNMLEENQIVSANPQYHRELKAILKEAADAETIIARVLNNLVQSYQNAGQWEENYLMIDLLEILGRHRGFEPRQEES